MYFNQNVFIFLFYFRLVLSDEEVNLGSEPGKMVDSLKCEMITYKRENSLLQPFQRDCINIHLIKKVKSLYVQTLLSSHFSPALLSCN